jgi:hypothetical protein
MTDSAPPKSWLEQAESDARTGEALLTGSPPLRKSDVGCHVAVICAQALEKGLKGYLYFNRTPPAMNHRPDKYVRYLLDEGGKFLRHPAHHKELSRLFNHDNKARLRELLDLTPGGRGNRNDIPNTEYPWCDADGVHTPMGHGVFADRSTTSQWVVVAKQITSGLHRLVISAELVAP